MTVDVELGRRERKKLERRATILKCAADLFEDAEFDDVSVRTIADAADVSLRTLYNFFPTKLDLLVGVHAQAIEERLDLALESLADPPSSPAEGVYRLAKAQLLVFDRLGKELTLRISLHGLAQGPGSGGGQDYARLDALSMEGFRRILELYAGRGALGKEPNVEAAARLVFAAANGEFFLWVSDPEQSIEGTLEHMREHIDLALGSRAD